MSALLLKDLLCIKKTGARLGIILILYVILFSTTDTAVMLNTMMIMASFFILINAFTYDELCKWDTYAISLPVTRKQMVMERYLLAVICDAVGIVLSLLISAARNSYTSTTLMELYVLSGVGFIMFAILLPLIYKLGTQKARLWLILIFFIPPACVIIAGQLGAQIQAAISNPALIQAATYASLPVGLLVFVLSFFLSYRIMRKKEF